MPLQRQWRFDVVSVYYEQPKTVRTEIALAKIGRPQIEVFRNCSLTA
jgi:hypothetical protein